MELVESGTIQAEQGNGFLARGAAQQRINQLSFCVHLSQPRGIDHVEDDSRQPDELLAGGKIVRIAEWLFATGDSQLLGLNFLKDRDRAAFAVLLGAKRIVLQARSCFPDLVTTTGTSTKLVRADNFANSCGNVWL